MYCEDMMGDLTVAIIFATDLTPCRAPEDDLPEHVLPVGVNDDEEFMVGDSIHLTCETGYTAAQGELIITCQDNASWSKPLGHCAREYLRELLSRLNAENIYVETT